MSILTVLAGNYLGNIAQDASSVVMKSAHNLMSGAGFERVFNNIDANNKLTLDTMNLTNDEKADILDLINIAKHGEMKSFELEIHGQLYSLDTHSLELKPVIA